MDNPVKASRFKKFDIIIANSELAKFYGWTKDRPMTIIGYHVSSMNVLNYRLLYHKSDSGVTDDTLALDFVDSNFRLANKVEKLLYVKV